MIFTALFGPRHHCDVTFFSDVIRHSRHSSLTSLDIPDFPVTSFMTLRDQELKVVSYCPFSTTDVTDALNLNFTGCHSLAPKYYHFVMH